MSWWRGHWRLGVALIVTGLGLILALVLWTLHRNREAAQLQSQLALMNTSLKVVGLEADKKARQAELSKNAEAAAELDKKILEAKKRTVSVTQTVDAMSDAEVIEAFKRLGY
jgi:uncharacterized protein HemX